MATHEDSSVEIMQTEKAREEKTTPPERERNPGIHIIVIPRRWVVSNDRRAFVVIIVVYHGRVGRGLIFSVLARPPRDNG